MRIRRIFVPTLLLLWLAWENYGLQVTVTELASDRLPGEFDGFRIVVLSDLHGRQYGRENEDLLRTVAEQHPDLICLTGDLADEGTELSALEPLLRGLCALADTVYVTGNHEWQLPDPEQWLRRCEALGVRVLQNTHSIVKRGEAQLVVAGVDDPCGRADRKSPEQVARELPEGFRILLSHRNEALPLRAGPGIDLVLSGHAHGGTIRLPFVGGLVGSGGRLFPRYEAGLYRMGRTGLYVSRGLSSGRAPLRLFNRPEVAVLILESVNKS